jgi:uncharacterized ferritin-like protein (DUF455 family)
METRGIPGTWSCTSHSINAYTTMSHTFATISVASHQHARHTQPKARAKLAPDQLKERQDATAARQTTIDEAMAKWWSDSMALADDLAQRFKMKPKYFHELMFQGGAHMIHHQTKINPYNAFKAEKAAECRASTCLILSSCQI